MRSDTSLIRDVLNGRTDAFSPLVARYQGGVYALVWSLVRDFASTEDLTQDVFITAYTRLSELREPARFPAWLRRIAANTARMRLRELSSRETTGDMDQVVAPNDTGGGGLRKEIAEVLASLPQKKREVAILCYLDGVSRKDAARFLGVPEATLRKRLHDAKRVLQSKIVEAAEKNLEEHFLPKGFASRCICECKRAVDAKRKEMMSMSDKRKNCGCGCWPWSRSETKGNRREKEKDKPRSKTSKPAKGGR